MRMTRPYPRAGQFYSVALDNFHADSDIGVMVNIGLLALPNCLMSGIIGPLEIFHISNSVVESGKPVFGPVELLGVTGGGASFTGLPIRTHRPMQDAEPDIVIIPPVFCGLEKLLRRRRITQWLLKRHESGAVIATCCAGSFLLAETGLLDGKAATTHWNLVRLFRERYPDVDLRPQMMLIDGGHYICAGGIMAWQDLSLHIVSRFMGGEIASHCAKLLVMDGTRQVQTPYFMFDQQHSEGGADPGVDTVRKWMRRNYREHVSLEGLAATAGMGVRTFLRRFKRATGQTPLNYLQQLRIEAARHLLEVSTRNIEEITGLTGYVDSSSFRRLFKEKTGLTPREYRNRFHRLA